MRFPPVRAANAAVITSLALVAVSLPAAQAAPGVGANPAAEATVSAYADETRTSSCTDKGEHSWIGRAVWGGEYRDGAAVKRIVNDFVGFTSPAADVTTVDYSVMVYNGAGKLISVQKEDNRAFGFDDGTAYLSRNPRNPPSAPGAAKIVVSVGDGNDGYGNCTMTFVQPRTTPITVVVPAAGQVFAPSSFWYQQVPADAPVNANSAAYAGRLVRDAASTGSATVNTVGYAPPIYTVAAGTPRQKIYQTMCNGEPSDPAWNTQEWSRQFDSVPIPSGATAGVGEDKEIVLWSPSTNELWELWHFEWTGSQFQACWGGKIDNTKTNNGTFPQPFGVTASGLSLLGGSITVADVQSGSINHAVAIGINAPHTTSFSWPANRTDGTDPSAAAIPEGLRLRLDPSLNLDTLGLTPFGKMIAKAAQQYGFIVRDRTGGPLVVYAESSVPYTRAGQPEPYDSRFGSQATNSWMKNFPWNKMQGLPKDYGKP